MSVLSTAGRRLLLAAPLSLFLAAAAVPGASARAQADDDDEKPPIVAPQQLLYLVNETMFNRTVYGTLTPERAREKLESVLSLRIASVERSSAISRAQKERLALAGRGDIKRIFDRIEDRKGVLNRQIDQEEYRRLIQELRPIQLLWLQDPFREGSYFSKALKMTLEEGQAKRLTKVEGEAKRLHYRARIDQVIVSLDTFLGLSADQRRRLTSLLVEETRPPLIFGSHDVQVVLHQMASLPEAKVRPIFDDPQWRTLEGRLIQARAMKPFLVSNGYLAEDAADGPGRPRDRTRRCSRSRDSGHRGRKNDCTSHELGRSGGGPRARPRGRGPAGDRPGAGRALRRGRPARRARDVRPRNPVPRRHADREGRLDRGPARTGLHRAGLDGLARLGGRPQLRALQQPRAEGATEHHQGAGPQHGHPRQQHVPSWLRDARPGRGVRRGRRSHSLARREGRALGRTGTRVGGARRHHRSKQEPARGLALPAGQQGRRHIGQRRRPGRSARGAERRHRGPRRGDRPRHRLLQADDLPLRDRRLCRRHGRVRRLAGATSIATLVFSLARRKDMPEFKATLGYLTNGLEQMANGYPEYTRYYQSQALFQGDVAAWEKWNKQLVRQFKQTQRPDGSFSGQYGLSFSTSMSLLALALNYRFLPIYER